jgi:hypothetical protein
MQLLEGKEKERNYRNNETDDNMYITNLSLNVLSSLHVFCVHKILEEHRDKENVKKK